MSRKRIPLRISGGLPYARCAPPAAQPDLARFYLARSEPDDLEKALRLLHELRSSAGGSAEVLNETGIANFQLGRYREAVLSFTEALEADPKMAEALFNKAYTEERVDARAARRDWERFIGDVSMTRQILCVITTFAIAWLPGCHRNTPASNDNKNRSEAQPRVEASRYPYTPPTTSDRRITLGISEGGQTAKFTQLEGHIVRIEKGPRRIWRRGDSEEWTIGLVCSITSPTTARISLLSINAAMDPGQPLFSERAEPVGSYDLAVGAPQAIGKNPTLDIDLLAIVTPTESVGARAEHLPECCVGCGALHVCAISVVLGCGSCKVLDEGRNEQGK